MKIVLFIFAFVACVSSADIQKSSEHNWSILNTVAYKGKQDDIYFINRNQGWYVNGAGFIYRTEDAGTSWQELVHMPGTYFRAIAFADDKNGFAGNIGVDYFPGVNDETPLYQTKDGGKTWSAVNSITNKDIKGICAIDVLKTKFINAGNLEERTSIYAAGRVGGPAKLIISKDGGLNWKKIDMTPYTAMIQDVKFINESTGFICAGSDPDVAKSNAQILKTVDGGVTWKTVYKSNRPVELIWKCSFPTDTVGFATVLNYDPASEQKYVVTTNDAGDTWKELPLTKNAALKEFGVGFLDDNTGWVGASNGIWETKDGGQSWNHFPVSQAINKIRVIQDDKGAVVYGIGVGVIKLEINK